MNIDQIQSKIQTFVDERDWEQFHSIKNLAMALSVETSELVELFQWMKEEDTKTLSPEKKAKLEDEVSDVLYYLLRIVKKADINLEQAFLNKMEKNAKKYPAQQVRGSIKKYNEY